MSSLQVSQGHVVRPYLQHRTATFLWYFASGKKWGIIEKSDSGQGTCVKHEGCAVASSDKPP